MPEQDWIFEEGELGTLVVAAAVLPERADRSGRMIVVGDASFAETNWMQTNPGNLLFLANAIDWLAQDEALISIRSKNRTPPSLVFESDASRNLLALTVVVLVWVISTLLLGGFVRVNGRRRRAESRWAEIVS
jgi:ABC-type uncharacterized transport system involved in gliding motility auxiliary subunit